MTNRLKSFVVLMMCYLFINEPSLIKLRGAIQALFQTKELVDRAN